MKNPSRSRRVSSPVHRSLSTSESGQGTMELALCLPLFVLLILGGSEIANVAWASVQINNAARAGAAFGSLSRANAADTTHIGKAAQNEAPKYITAPSTQVTSSQTCTCVTPSSGAETTPATCTATLETTCVSPNVILASVQVTVHAPVAPLIHYPGLPASYTMHAQASMGILQ